MRQQNYLNLEKSFMQKRKVRTDIKKSKQEFQSCLWAKDWQNKKTKDKVVSLPETVNSYDAEFAHTVYDGKLIFSSLRADSIVENEVVYSKSYKTRIYASTIEDSSYSQNKLIKDLFF